VSRVAHVVLRLRDLRALVRLGRERVADDALLGRIREGGEELVVDVTLHVDARASAARLAVVPAGRRMRQQTREVDAAR
jgi:hypothetical protein